MVGGGIGNESLVSSLNHTIWSNQSQNYRNDGGAESEISGVYALLLIFYLLNSIFWKRAKTKPIKPQKKTLIEIDARTKGADFIFAKTKFIGAVLILSRNWSSKTKPPMYKP